MARVERRLRRKGGLREGLDRAAMIPLAVFLLACAAVYLGTIEAAFSALMRLSLRLLAERSDRPGALGDVSRRSRPAVCARSAAAGLVTVTATALLARGIGSTAVHRTLIVVVERWRRSSRVCELLLPLLIVSRDPERVLELLLPSFRPFARAARPDHRMDDARVAARQASPPPPAAEEPAAEADEVPSAYIDTAEQEGIIEGEERRLLQSIVDFGDTLVREIMTPRPDIVAIRDDATVGDLRALFREQEYSRFPVYKDNLDNIAGFVFVKDLVALEHRDDARPITPLLRPAVIVPESKRVPELLKQFQRQQTQIAIVVDEYGGTAGLVTIEDMLEEIVGEIRDEYDVESEPVVDEGGGRFVFNGKVDIDEVRQRLNVQIEREGFETVGGFLLTHLGRVPAVGEQVDIDGLHVEVLEVERRRVNKVRIDAARSCVDEPAARARCDEVRIRLVHRPAQRRQVDAAEPARRHEARHRLRQAADDADPDSGRAELSRRAGRVSRHAGHPSAAAPHERADGRRRARHDPRSGRARPGASTSSEKPGKGDRYVLDLVKDVEDAGLPHPEQDRSDQEVEAAADHRPIQRGRQLCRDRPGLGRDRRERRPARAGHHRPAAGGRGALSRRTT